MNFIQLYHDIGEHLWLDNMPSNYLNILYSDPAFGLYPFCMLQRMKRTEQSPRHHAEGNVWNHTMLVVDEAAKVKTQSRDPKIFMWAALLHDIGKPPTTNMKRGKITSHNHDKVGAKLSEEFLRVFTDDTIFIREVSELILYHMQILYVQKDLPFADINGMVRSTDIREVALLGLCDRLGRLNSDRAREQANIQLFIDKCNHYLTEKASAYL